MVEEARGSLDRSTLTSDVGPEREEGDDFAEEAALEAAAVDLGVVEAKDVVEDAETGSVDLIAVATEDALVNLGEDVVEVELEEADFVFWSAEDTEVVGATLGCWVGWPTSDRQSLGSSDLQNSSSVIACCACSCNIAWYLFIFKMSMYICIFHLLGCVP